jgi:hypothetical protein
MSFNKRLCFLYTQATHDTHKTNDDITKKNLFCFARPISINYMVGYVKNNEFVLENKVNKNVKPNTLKNFETIIQELKNDIKNVDIIVSHNADFHIKTIIAESLKYNIMIDFNKYVIVDTMSFYHDYNLLDLKDLATKINIEYNEDHLELVQNVFFKLYLKSQSK